MANGAPISPPRPTAEKKTPVPSDPKPSWRASGVISGIAAPMTSVRCTRHRSTAQTELCLRTNCHPVRISCQTLTCATERPPALGAGMDSSGSADSRSPSPATKRGTWKPPVSKVSVAPMAGPRKSPIPVTIASAVLAVIRLALLLT